MSFRAVLADSAVLYSFLIQVDCGLTDVEFLIKDQNTACERVCVSLPEHYLNLH